VLGSKRVEDIRPGLVGAFLQHLQAEKGLSPATARKVRTVLSAVLSYAVAMEYVESNAAMKVPPPEVDASERVAPTLEETARILLEAETSDPDFLTYLWVAAETGGRRGETLALRWGGVDLAAGTISVDSTVSIGDDGSHLRSTTKTKKSRKIALSSITLAHVRAQAAAVMRFSDIDQIAPTMDRVRETGTLRVAMAPMSFRSATSILPMNWLATIFLLLMPWRATSMSIWNWSRSMIGQT